MMDMATSSDSHFAKALEAGAIQVGRGIVPQERKPSALIRFHGLDDAQIVFVQKNAAAGSGMIAQNGDLAAGGANRSRAPLAKIGDRAIQIARDRLDLGVANLDESRDEATSPAPQASELVRIFFEQHGAMSLRPR